MEYNIRPYINGDYQRICAWWVGCGEQPPLSGMMVEDGTFVLELNKVPALSLTVLLTQSKEMAYIEGFIKNPLFREISLEFHGKLLWNHCFEYAKSKGYKRVICFPIEEKLFSKYERFGMIKNKQCMSFVREL